MTVRLSTGMRNKLLDGGTGGGVKGALELGFIGIYTGAQPASADTGATGTLLGVVTRDGDGATGLQFGSASAGVIAKAAQVWRFTGLADGTAGWWRFYPAGDTPTSNSSTAARIDGSVGSAGADINMTNVTVQTSAVSTVDSFTITMPTSV
jgi:hypothetical protein